MNNDDANVVARLITKSGSVSISELLNLYQTRMNNVYSQHRIKEIVWRRPDVFRIIGDTVKQDQWRIQLNDDDKEKYTQLKINRLPRREKEVIHDISKVASIRKYRIFADAPTALITFHCHQDALKVFEKFHDKRYGHNTLDISFSLPFNIEKNCLRLCNLPSRMDDLMQEIGRYGAIKHVKQNLMSLTIEFKTGEDANRVLNKFRGYQLTRSDKPLSIRYTRASVLDSDTSKIEDVSRSAKIDEGAIYFDVKHLDELQQRMIENEIMRYEEMVYTES